MTKIIKKTLHIIMRRLSADKSLVGSLFLCGADEEVVGGSGVVGVKVWVRQRRSGGKSGVAVVVIFSGNRGICEKPRGFVYVE